MEIRRGVVVLAAGGTGGHLFPAQALAEELVARGFLIHLITDERVADYGKAFPAIETHIVPSTTISLSKPWLLPERLFRLFRGVQQAKAILKRLQPDVVVGFGGYPSFPPIIAASRLGIPSCVHDQNAVMGRANRFLSRFVDAVASSFPKLAKLPEQAKAKLVVTGNPVRGLGDGRAGLALSRHGCGPAVQSAGVWRQPGGALLCRIHAQGHGGVAAGRSQELRLTQQCRPEDMEAVKAVYESLNFKFDLRSFFMDMPLRIANAHLVICRSGASTIAELGVIGRPAIMVPLPHALDNDQLRNAESFAQAGAGWIKPQADLVPGEFAAFLTRLRYEEGELRAAAKAALTTEDQMLPSGWPI